MTDINQVSNIVNWEGIPVRYTWVPGSDDSNFKPFKQVYGVVFDENNDVLVINEDGKWKIPGGTPEKGESALEAFIREIGEEANITIKNIRLIGAQRVEFLKYGNPNHEEGDRFYQLRFIADINRAMPRTPDPDGGEIHPRKFIKFEELTNLVNWGSVGQAMFQTAKSIHENSI